MHLGTKTPPQRKMRMIREIAGPEAAASKNSLRLPPNSSSYICFRVRSFLKVPFVTAAVIAAPFLVMMESPNVRNNTQTTIAVYARM
mmetsp:Transcript_3534/g.9343  ORF Transcript_3534/g.9343 Transcript_3534/m.9343 type:complete len:87 (-) Transcript_3534:299-559(-)